MRDFVVSIVLGITEGVTEFVPISASAHLRIVEAMLRVHLSGAFWRLYLIIVHLGAVMALLALYARQLAVAARMPGNRTRAGQGLVAHSPLTIGLAFLAAGLGRYTLCRFTGVAPTGISVFAVCLIAGGAIMWVVDALADEKAAREQVTAAGAVWIGACESFSGIVPGLSRCLLTMTAGEIAGLSRLAAVEFSFLLFVPSTLAEVFFEIHAMTRANTAASVMDPHGLALLAMGFFTSAATAYVSANWMLKRSVRHSFAGFCLYRICLGFALIA